jgi:hypothetical protein
MQDMSNMGQVAQRYMQLFNAAVAQKKGVASCSFEDWLAVSAAIEVFGWEGAMNHFKISQSDWTTITAHWMGEVAKDPMNLGMRKNTGQAQEADRLRAGGQPKPSIPITRTAPGAAPAGGAAAFDPAAAQAAMMQGAQANQHAWQAYAANVMNDPRIQAAVQMAGAQNVMGGGSALIVGRRVMVRWNDGNQYPGTISQVAAGQSMVIFPDGRNMWIDNQVLTPA